MRESTVILALLIAACEAPVRVEVVEAPFAPDSGNIAVRCGTLIDGLSDTPETDRVVVIVDGKFAGIMPGASGTPSSMPVLDLGDYTCLPGLIDTHTHRGNLRHGFRRVKSQNLARVRPDD